MMAYSVMSTLSDSSHLPLPSEAEDTIAYLIVVDNKGVEHARIHHSDIRHVGAGSFVSRELMMALSSAREVEANANAYLNDITAIRSTPVASNGDAG